MISQLFLNAKQILLINSNPDLRKRSNVFKMCGTTLWPIVFILLPSARKASLPELETIIWDTFNPDCLIRISNVGTFNILLNPLFFGYSTEKSKTGFSKLSFKISNFPASDTGLWLVEFYALCRIQVHD